MRLGPYEATAVSDGSYRLDGGSMFGIVPRVLWEPLHPPDEQNRIEIALNCLLLRGDDRVILIDNGMGHGWSEKELSIYGLHRPQGDLVDDLARHGVTPEDVTDMVLTHLHFDHAGGTVRLDTEEPTLTFPNARHWLQSQNYRWAEDPTDRDRASYRSERWSLLHDDDRLQLVDGSVEFLPGLQSIPVHGHTAGQQLILVGDADGEQLLYCGDLLPFASHIRLPYIMSFDLHPLITLNEKKDILARAATRNWQLMFEHDPVHTFGRVSAEDGVFQFVPAS